MRVSSPNPHRKSHLYRGDWGGGNSEPRPTLFFLFFSSKQITLEKKTSVVPLVLNFVLLWLNPSYQLVSLITYDLPPLSVIHFSVLFYRGAPSFRLISNGSRHWTPILQESPVESRLKLDFGVKDSSLGKPRREFESSGLHTIGVRLGMSYVVLTGTTSSESQDGVDVSEESTLAEEIGVFRRGVVSKMDLSLPLEIWSILETRLHLVLAVRQGRRRDWTRYSNRLRN